MAVVSCYAEEDVPGFMSSLGLIDDRCVLRPFNAKGGGGVPIKFRGVDQMCPYSGGGKGGGALPSSAVWIKCVL